MRFIVYIFHEDTQDDDDFQVSARRDLRVRNLKKKVKKVFFQDVGLCVVSTNVIFFKNKDQNEESEPIPLVDEDLDLPISHFCDLHAFCMFHFTEKN